MAASSSVAHALEQMDVLVGEKLQIVTYKTLCRTFGLSGNVAKRVLFEFVEKRRGQVSAVYCLSGLTKAEPVREVVQLVGADQLAASREALGTVRGMHIFSVQPRIPKDPSEMLESDKAATEDAMLHLLKGEDSWVADNRFSQVQASFIKRDPSARPPQSSSGPAPASTPAQPNAQPKAKDAPAAAPKDAGRTSGMFSKAEQGKAKAKDEAAAKPKPAAPTASSQDVALKSAGSQGKSTKGSLGALWSKASTKPKQQVAKKEQPKAVAEPEKPAPVEVDSDAEDEEEIDEIQVMNAANRQQRRLCLDADDEDEDAADSDSEKAEPPKEVAKPTASRRKVVAMDEEEDEGEDEGEDGKENSGSVQTQNLEDQQAMEVDEEAQKAKRPKGKRAKKDAPKAPTTKKASKKAKGSEDVESSGEQMEVEEEQEEPEQPAKKASAIMSAFSKKPTASAPARKRWVEKTYFDDKGNEVTEMVEEEVEETSGPSPAPAADPTPGPAPSKKGEPAAKKEKPAEIAAKKQSAAAKKSAAGGKGAAGSKQQPGIMSFFGKK